MRTLAPRWCHRCLHGGCFSRCGRTGWLRSRRCRCRGGVACARGSHRQGRAGGEKVTSVEHSYAVPCRSDGVFPPKGDLGVSLTLTSPSVEKGSAAENLLLRRRGMDSTPLPTKCPNCYEQLPRDASTTPTGVRVCDALCISGWMNGERHLVYLETVRKLKALIAA